MTRTEYEKDYYESHKTKYKGYTGKGHRKISDIISEAVPIPKTQE